MKSIEKLPIKHGQKIDEISDERNNNDGWWIYLKKEYADFDFDPWSPMRTIHEQSLSDCIRRVKKSVRLITNDDLAKFPFLK